jgi:hypothetical protein
MFASHIEHVQTHLERVRYGHLVDPAPDTVYLGAEDDTHFWELVGLRVEGCPVVVLALLRFQRLDLSDVAYGRESLSTYLSSLPYPGWKDEAGGLTATFPPHDHGIPFYLRRLRSGGVEPRHATLDPERIQVAFDFRLQNPILIPDFRDAADPLWDHCYRTSDGHVIRGRSHAVPVTPPEEPHQFLAISAAEQVTPTGTYPLPTLFLNRGYLAMRARAHSREEMATVSRWAPFVPAAGAQEGLLPLPTPPGLQRGIG